MSVFFFHPNIVQRNCAQSRQQGWEGEARAEQGAGLALIAPAYNLNRIVMPLSEFPSKSLKNMPATCHSTQLKALSCVSAGHIAARGSGFGNPTAQHHTDLLRWDRAWMGAQGMCWD